MKIAIYSIAKNEAANVNRFETSCQEADVVVVADTGSTDDTPRLLEQAGAQVSRIKIKPWRFDVARNQTLAMVPEDTDVCISLDMDELLQPGWRRALEQAWAHGVNLGSCQCVWSWRDTAQTQPAVICQLNRIHARHEFEWCRPVHEVLRPLADVEARQILVPGMLIHHYQRGVQRDYRPLLTALLAATPDDADAWLQRAADNLTWECWADAVGDYEQYLRLTQETDNPLLQHRRATVWVAIAQAYHKMGQANQSLQALLAGVAEYPDCREAWTYLADGWMQRGNWPSGYGAAMNALRITERTGASDEICWGDLPRQIASSAFARLMDRGMQ